MFLLEHYNGKKENRVLTSRGIWVSSQKGWSTTVKSSLVSYRPDSTISCTAFWYPLTASFISFRSFSEGNAPHLHVNLLWNRSMNYFYDDSMIIMLIWKSWYKIFKICVHHPINNEIWATLSILENYTKRRQKGAKERRNRHDMLIITGDMNAKVGNANNQGVGIHGLGVIDENDEMLCNCRDLNENSHSK